MNRSLAIYLLILDFFVFLIGAAAIYALRDSGVMWKTNSLVLFAAVFLCPLCSVLYIFSTRNSFPSPERETNTSIIDDLPSAEEIRFQPVSDTVKVLGVLAFLLSLGLFLEICYGIYAVYANYYPSLRSRSNSGLSVVFVVFLFNALCQPWYVWRTFNNVKMKKPQRISEQ
jgi:membrane protein implicated in regulation of membrane protease activity